MRCGSISSAPCSAVAFSFQSVEGETSGEVDGCSLRSSGIESSVGGLGASMIRLMSARAYCMRPCDLRDGVRAGAAFVTNSASSEKPVLFRSERTPEMSLVARARALTRSY